MSHFKFLGFLLFGIIIAGCGTGPDPEPAEWNGSWKEMGLEGEHILAMEISDEYLFAVSETAVFRQRRSENIINWEALDLNIDPEISEMADLLLTGHGLYAAVKRTSGVEDFPLDFKTLHRSTDEGDSWEPVQINNMEKQVRPYVMFHLTECCSDVLYAVSGWLYRSEDGGKNWKALDHRGPPQFVYMSEEHPNQIWIGGQTNIMSAYIEASKDFGETWVILSNNLTDSSFSSNAVYSALVSPEDENSVLAGLGGVIRKSEDGGESWRTVLKNWVIFAFANSRVHSGWVYAAGWFPEKGLFVAVSEDFGDTWDVEEHPDSPPGSFVRDMVLGMEDGEEVAYFGTGEGVYAYRFQ